MEAPTALAVREGTVARTGGDRYAIRRTPVQIVPERYESLLVVAPHPDDETIGAGGLVHAMRSLGRRVRVVVVSDGSASHPGSRAYPPVTLAALRRAETVAAMRRLGVPRGDIHFCGFEDGGSEGWDADLSATSRLVAALRGHHDLVCLPSADDNHIDHRKARELARRHLRSAGTRLDYLVWPIEGAQPITPNAAFPLSPAQLAAKCAAMRCYRSQLGLITDAPDGFTIDGPTLARFTAPVERFTL